MESLPPALLRRLSEIADRHVALQQQLSDPDVLGQTQRVIALTRESASIEPTVDLFKQWQATQLRIKEAHEMLASGDTEMAELAREDLLNATAEAAKLTEQLIDSFLTAEANVVDSFFFEIRAGTGGEEAALFARDLFEMYRKLCERRGWRFEVSDVSTSDRGGFKECIVNVRGNGAFRNLRFEGGGHRVQRVPETEGAGRIHTSAATVAVLPELPDVKIDINPKDIEEFGCRGGGPGGQNVNKVETGWFIRHKPSGLTFKMTEHKSQSQNKERAWALLRATLYEAEQAKQHAAQMGARKAMMGSGDRSQRIRTYNFPQNRCTDHRLGGDTGGEKNFNLDRIVAGEMDELIQALLDLDKRQRLEGM